MHCLPRLLDTTLLPRPDSVRVARELIRSMYAKVAVAADLDTALLLVSELVSNAILHARGSIGLTAVSARGRLRIQVTDASVRLPLAHYYSPDATTGRGLHLVDRLADSWGFDTLGPSGKAVWFELGLPRAPRTMEDGDSLAPQSGAALIQAVRATTSSSGNSCVVRLLRLPLRLRSRAAEYEDGLVRELTLLAAHSAQLGSSPLIPIEFVDELGELFAACPLDRQVGFTSAWLGGAKEVDADLQATPDAARDVVRLNELLTHAEELCQAGGLLTAPATEEVLGFRDWYVDEIVGQLNGSVPTPWPGPW